MGHGMTFPKYMSLDDKAKAREYDRYDHSLTGFVKGEGEARVSILGKLMGYDDAFSKDKIDELKKFIDDSGVLGLERAFGDSETLSVNKFIKRYTRKHGFSDFTFGGTKTAELLDSDMSVDEFKANWTKFALKKRFGLELDEELAKETINSINDLETQNEEDKKRRNLHLYKLLKNLKPTSLKPMRDLRRYINLLRVNLIVARVCLKF
ncbi:hypothetical protein VB002_11280 [Campylobacter concisus]